MFVTEIFGDRSALLHLIMFGDSSVIICHPNISVSNFGSNLLTNFGDKTVTDSHKKWWHISVDKIYHQNFGGKLVTYFFKIKKKKKWSLRLVRT